eukprot:TRINITY_DN5548_c0_g1_i1.p1 TRINITY_DN5548_c0_g1~~TRINITY_DN5548_c0_g1_i1.p1  ORF type:complete len:721 (-),score=141.79 TRINITY_DN5548_c0_g1_i1:151-2277(-)
MAADRYVERLKIIKQVRETASVGDKLAIPQLVVCGSQSVGKSTIMTACTDVEFPQGDGICTKAATVVSCSQDTGLEENLYEIEDVKQPPGVYKIVAREEVANEIRLTQTALLEKAGKKADDTWIVEEEIRLRVSGPEMMDIILVDLPGLIENAPDNVTEEDLEQMKQRIEKLIVGHIERPETLIAVVQRADEEVERVPAGRLAKKHDPKGERTFKIFNMFEEALFTNKDTLNRAINAVNTGGGVHPPHALTRKTKENTVKTKDQEFEELTNHGIRQSRSGIESLKLRLQQMFSELINVNLPKLFQTVRTGLDETTRKLSQIAVGEELSPIHMLQQVVCALEESRTSLTKALTEKICNFRDSVRETRKEVTLEFVSKDYQHDASKPGELQLEEEFLAALQNVTELWRPHLDRFTDSVACVTKKWFSDCLDDLDLQGCRSMSLKSALHKKFSFVFDRLITVFLLAAKDILSAEAQFGTVNDHYFNAKKRQYDILPKDVEDEFRNVMAAKTKALWAARDKKLTELKNQKPCLIVDIYKIIRESDATFHEEMMEAVFAFRDAIKIENQNMVENNKREIHSLVMANFDVAKKTLCDCIWKATLDFVGPRGHQRSLRVGMRSAGMKQDGIEAAPSILDWIKYAIMVDADLVKAAVEDENVKEERAMLKGKKDRLERCYQLLETLTGHLSRECETMLRGGPSNTLASLSSQDSEF